MTSAAAPGLSPAATDPNAFAASAQWVQGALLGSVATAVAVIAVATVGLLMLTGRLNLRRGATVIVGCFILFGASSIANGLRNAATAGQEGSTPPAAPVEAAQIDPALIAAPPPPPADPYAGATVRR